MAEDREDVISWGLTILSPGGRLLEWICGKIQYFASRPGLLRAANSNWLYVGDALECVSSYFYTRMGGSPEAADRVSSAIGSTANMVIGAAITRCRVGAALGGASWLLENLIEGIVLTCNRQL